MSPFCLIEVTHLHNRAGITPRGHFQLNPSRLLSALGKLFSARRPACHCRRIVKDTV
jgi:hypothetical protein